MHWNHSALVWAATRSLNGMLRVIETWNKETEKIEETVTEIHPIVWAVQLLQLYKVRYVCSAQPPS